MKIVIMLFLSLIYFSCSNNSEKESETGTVQTHEVKYNYQLIHGEGLEIESDVKITLGVEGEKFSGKGPVNNFFGQLKDGIAVEPIGMTMMAGPEPMMQMETLFFTLLEGGKFTGIGEDTLKIRKNNQVVLTYLLSESFEK